MTELLHSLSTQNEFVARHNGPDKREQSTMLKTVNAESLHALIAQTVPAQIRLEALMQLAPAQSEDDMLATMKSFAKLNQLKRTFIGQGYYNTFTPNVILRNVMENLAGTPLTLFISQKSRKAVLNRCLTISRW